MLRRGCLILGLATAALAPAAAAQSQRQQPPTGNSQDFFRRLLLADPATSDAIKTLLRDEGGFVNRQVRFKDLTGDGRSDAVVRVASGGSAGDVAFYVFSTARGGKLRAVYRKQSLYRVQVAVHGTKVVYRVPRWAAGDEPCCPAKVFERTIQWSKKGRRFGTVATREIPRARLPASPPPG